MVPGVRELAREFERATLTRQLENFHCGDVPCVDSGALDDCRRGITEAADILRSAEWATGRQQIRLSVDRGAAGANECADIKKWLPRKGTALAAREISVADAIGHLRPRPWSTPHRVNPCVRR